MSEIYTQHSEIHFKTQFVHLTWRRRFNEELFASRQSLDELVLERIVESAVQNRVGKRRAHSNQMAESKAEPFSFIVLH